MDHAPTTEQRQVLLDLLERCRHTLDRKGQDYADDRDLFFNFHLTGSIMDTAAAQGMGGVDLGLLALVLTKIGRIVQLTSSSEGPQNEALMDSFVDLANYSLLWGAIRETEPPCSRTTRPWTPPLPGMEPLTLRLASWKRSSTRSRNSSPSTGLPPVGEPGSGGDGPYSRASSVAGRENDSRFGEDPNPRGIAPASESGDCDRTAGQRYDVPPETLRRLRGSLRVMLTLLDDVAAGQE